MDETEEEVHVRNMVLSACDLKQQGSPPLGRAGAACVSVGTRVFLYGGWNESQVFSETYLLEIEQMRWTQIETSGSRPPALYGHNLIVISDFELLLIGGLTPDPAGISASPPFLTKSEAWQSNLACSVNQHAYLFDTRSFSWTKLQFSGDPLPPLAFCAAAAVAPGQALVHGGFTDASFRSESSSAFLLELKNNSISVKSVDSLASLGRRAGHAMCMHANSLYLFGGDDNGLYVIDRNSWTANLAETSGSTPPCGRRFFSLAAVGSRLCVFAGDARGDFYAFSEKRWMKPLYEGSMSLSAQTAAAVHDKLIIFGGIRRKALTADDETSGGIKVSRKLFFMNILEIKDNRGSSGEFKFKLVTVGDSGVGKSCLLTRFVSDRYTDFHVSTIAFDFQTVVTMIKGKLARLQLWDTAGQERFSVVAGSFYRGADGFVIVYDATSRSSFDHVEQWIQQIQQHQSLGPGSAIILVGNKYDLVDKIVVSEDEGRLKASKLGAVFVPASAKSSNNVDFAFLAAASALVDARKAVQAAARPAQSTVNLRAPQQSSAACCA